MTLGPEYFEKVYAASGDPWGFTTRWYEERKYALTVAMLPRRRYADAFEPGCSIGVLTALLAPRCDRLLSCDVSPEAVRQARERVPGARVERRTLPAGWPEGTFDLIVFSEFLYYLGPEDLRRVLRLAGESLAPGGTLLAVHWRHLVPDYPQTGDEVHAALGRTGLSLLAEHREADFVAEVYVNGPAVSVAAAEGLT
ncbi:SAM-dependent methyltransferase [Actinomadura sp. DC4]|uniref:class I SAM-dependent DNA methyltransferase n=1 Tax=Actinomadura sp. DC4 TaxID=3055069 RepID=UPI0025AFAA4F|nr:SAM-dependent methyltransferase [Actinomadura sp. DC4]MDN3358746.1 SAM-dependent methyltransferase [Actinomadura sp. DC4]